MYFFALGLPPTGSWQDLKDHMREAGDVCYADVYKDGTGVVEFMRYEDMKYAARKLDDSKFRSHEVRYIPDILQLRQQTVMRNNLWACSLLVDDNKEEIEDFQDTITRCKNRSGATAEQYCNIFILSAPRCANQRAFQCIVFMFTGDLSLYLLGRSGVYSCQGRLQRSISV